MDPCGRQRWSTRRQSGRAKAGTHLELNHPVGSAGGQECGGQRPGLAGRRENAFLCAVGDGCVWVRGETRWISAQLDAADVGRGSKSIVWVADKCTHSEYGEIPG